VTTSVNPYAPPSTEPPLVAGFAITGDEISVDYELGPDDVIAWNMVLQRVSQTARRTHRLIRLLTMLAVVLSLLISVIDWPKNWHFSLLAIPMVILAAAWPWIYRWRIGNALRNMLREGKNYSILGPRRLTITPQFVIVATPVSQGATRWIGVERVIAEPDSIYIMVSSHAAHIVPRRAFASDEQFRHFGQCATRFHAQATEGSPS
jgi:hypothetical protein